MPDLNVHLLELLFLDFLFLDQRFVLFFTSGQVLLNLIISVNHFLLFLLKLDNLLLSASNLTEFMFLLIVDHDVLTFKQIKVFFNLLLPSVRFFLLGVQVLNLTNQKMVVLEQIFLLVPFGLDFISSRSHQLHRVVVCLHTVSQVDKELVVQQF